MMRLLAALAVGALVFGSTAYGQRAADLAGEVNPFIGTTNEGLEFPGAVMPFGMAAFSPEEIVFPGSRLPTLANGYEWRATQIKGFSLTHLMGAGCPGSSGDVPFMPVTVPVDRSPQPKSAEGYYASSFVHANEHALPGAYSVRLDTGVRVDLGATLRTGAARFAFPAGKPANLLIRIANSQVGSEDAEIAIDAAHRTVSGWVRSGNFCGNNPSRNVSYYTLHFVAEFDRPFGVGGTWQDDALHPGTTSARGGTGYGKVPLYGKGSGGWLTFRPGQAVGVRVGISYVDEAGARANLRAENAAGTTLEQVRARARAAWNQRLGKIAVQGGTRDERTVFYTALYHALIHPTLNSDVDGRYRGMDKAVHALTRFQKAQYVNFSGWDVYRSQVQLVTLLDPQVGSDFAQSLLNQADQNGGVWDRWTHVTGTTGVMNGDPSPPTLAAIRAFGGDGFDAASAYASLRKAATVPTALDTDPGGPRNGLGQRPALDQYLRLKYVPAGAHLWGPVASTLEYAAADFGLAELARQLGKSDDAAMFRERAGWWRNLYNPQASPKGGYLQQRNADGSWVPGFTPGTGDGFVEGSAAQYLWMVPFDPAGLFETLGGRDTATARLDAYFRDEGGRWIVTDPAGGSTEKAGREHPEMGNEPSIGGPWLYNFVGQPWKTQAVVRTAMRQIWTNTPDGLPGNDDLGEMSSWYVWAALGLYPLYPGRAELIVGSPLFPQATIARPGGRTIVIRGHGAAMNAPYVRSLQRDGRQWTRSWLPADLLTKGGTLDFTLDTSPDPAWGAAPADVPPSFGPRTPIERTN